VEKLASRLIPEKRPSKSNGLTNQENLKNGFRFLVKVSLCQISALKLFTVAQNLVAKLGL
jgi:hypothetical protein